MKKILFSLLSVCFGIMAYAQDNFQSQAKSIIGEGINIYQMEMANWISPKLFAAKYKGKEKIGGNLSYLEAGKTKTIFFTKGEKPKVLGTVVFDPAFNDEQTQVDLMLRDLTPSEKELHILLANASKTITDVGFFPVPSNSVLRVIPVIENGDRKVYVMAQSNKTGAVIFGNDFLLSYDSKLNLTDKRALHKNLAVVTYDPEAGRENNSSSSHAIVGEKSDFPTSTDIATLLLYEKMTKWSQHTFISENNIFFWDYASRNIQVMPKKSPDTKY